ncbi:MAG: hypothetical protein M1826_000111 [Phylliscum demangeonii]|nr:MAG: hypothetical protein M1826_000111 [Phylliscum demangeonii]
MNGSDAGDERSTCRATFTAVLCNADHPTFPLLGTLLNPQQAQQPLRLKAVAAVRAYHQEYLVGSEPTLFGRALRPVCATDVLQHHPSSWASAHGKACCLQTESIRRGAQHALDLHYHIPVAQRPALREFAGPVFFLLSYDLKLRVGANSLLECQRRFRRHLARRFERVTKVEVHGQCLQRNSVKMVETPEKVPKAGGERTRFRSQDQELQRLRAQLRATDSESRLLEEAFLATEKDLGFEREAAKEELPPSARVRQRPSVRPSALL